MSTVLAELAGSAGVSERTLRRAFSLGTIRGERLSAHKLYLPVAERTYIRSRWPILSALRGALRTEPGVSMAVLFGSVARGEDLLGSDVDLLLALRDENLRSRVALTERLRRRTGLAVETVSLPDALAHPALMVEILREGRVLIDRDGRWPALRSIAEELRERSEQERRLRAAHARDAAAAFQARAPAAR